jgi:HPt (histidine-containing phosphotransfer) domain-containing protein
MKSSVTAAEPVEVSADAAPAATAAAIDHAHLARMTFGDRKLENEVLDLFERQAGMLLGRMDGAAPALMAALAHTLSGSASGIGAWRVAWAAFELERVASGREQGDIAAASARVCAELAVTRIAIAERRRSA